MECVQEAAAILSILPISRAAVVVLSSLYLTNEPIDAGELSARSGIARSTLSGALRELVAARFVRESRVGRRQFFHISGDVATCEETLFWLKKAIADQLANQSSVCKSGNERVSLLQDAARQLASELGAGDGDRTRNPRLGKPMLYR
jgi:DNA-binding transcriptional regulator GbsR (MarR family)